MSLYSSVLIRLGLALLFAFYHLSLSAGCFEDISQVLKKGRIARQSNLGPRLNSKDYYLWDNWSLVDRDGTIHVYALSASREHTPAQRHFHAEWRHFASVDNGKNFADLGIILKKNKRAGSFDDQAIWSGSIAQLSNGKYLAAYTGLSSRRQFLQSIGLSISSDGHNFKPLKSRRAIIDHESMRELFIEKGYYVDKLHRIGNPHGEENGSIQALRDPYIFESDKGIEIFWAAKSYNQKGEVISSIGHATIKDLNHPSKVILNPPINPPDGHTYSQLELPNIVKQEDGSYLWFISTTNRMSEADPETSIEMMSRVYRSKTIDSPLELLPGRSSSELYRANDGYTYGLNIVRRHDNKLQGRVFQVEFDPKGRGLSLPPTFNLKF